MIDTYVLVPFSLAGPKKCIDELVASDSCRLAKREQVLTIVAEGPHIFSFEGRAGRI
jgi:hypothetical protein